MMGLRQVQLGACMGHGPWGCSQVGVDLPLEFHTHTLTHMLTFTYTLCTSPCDPCPHSPPTH
jgi:hypothetical protein